jgi:hypothetical protein
MTLVDERFREVAADESGAAGDEDLETFQCGSLLTKGQRGA